MAGADDEIVDADIVEDEEPPAPQEDEPPASKSKLRDLGIWFGEAGVTLHTGKGAGEKNDKARFAWIAEHLASPSPRPSSSAARR